MATGQVGALGELFARRRRIGNGAQQLANVLEADHPAQSVRAQENRVSFAQLAKRKIDLNGIRGAESLQDDVVVLERLGFLLGELPRLDELIDERLVARQLHELTLPKEIATRVAHLGEKEMVVEQRGRRDRRAHSASRAIELGLLKDAQ